MPHTAKAEKAHDKTDEVTLSKLDEAHAEFDAFAMGVSCRPTTELLTLFLGGEPAVKKLFTKSTDTPELAAAAIAKIGEEIDRRIGIPPVHKDDAELS